MAMRAGVFPVLAALSGLLVNPVSADQTFMADQGHTEVTFGWSHAGVSIQHGEFDKVVATLSLADDIENSSVSVTIDTSSLSSGFPALDKHLMSKDFLEVETFPEITFDSSSITKNSDTELEVTGDLTIHGVTQPVTLSTVITHQGEHPLGQSIDYYKGEWIAFHATTEIDHQSFNVGNFSTGPISIAITTEMKTK